MSSYYLRHGNVFLDMLDEMKGQLSTTTGATIAACEVGNNRQPRTAFAPLNFRIIIAVAFVSEPARSMATANSLRK